MYVSCAVECFSIWPEHVMWVRIVICSVCTRSNLRQSNLYLREWSDDYTCKPLPHPFFFFLLSLYSPALEPKAWYL